MPPGYRRPGDGFRTPREREREAARGRAAPGPVPRPLSPGPIIRTPSPGPAIRPPSPLDAIHAPLATPPPAAPPLANPLLADPPLAPHPEIARLRREVVDPLSSIDATADQLVETMISEELREVLGAPFLRYVESEMDGLRFRVRRTEVFESRGGWRARVERLRDVVDTWEVVGERNPTLAKRLLDAYYHFLRPTKVKVFGSILKPGPE